MRIGASLALIAIGAVLKFAVTKHISGVSLDVIGVILMAVGAVGLLLTLVFMSMRRRTDVVYSRNGVSYVEPAAPDDRYLV